MGVDLELLFQIKREINFIRIRAKADTLMLSIFSLRGQADREKFSRCFSYFNLIESLLSLGMRPGAARGDTFEKFCIFTNFCSK
jgi:hypothetical protein